MVLSHCSAAPLWADAGLWDGKGFGKQRVDGENQATGPMGLHLDLCPYRAKQLLYLIVSDGGGGLHKVQHRAPYLPILHSSSSHNK